MKTLKKYLSVLTILSLFVFVLSGCGQSESTTKPEDENQPDTTVVEEPEVPETEISVPEEEPEVPDATADELYSEISKKIKAIPKLSGIKTSDRFIGAYEQYATVMAESVDYVCFYPEDQNLMNAFFTLYDDIELWMDAITEFNPDYDTEDVESMQNYAMYKSRANDASRKILEAQEKFIAKFDNK